MTLDLSLLPPPSVVQVLDYEAILGQYKARAVELMPELAPVIDLESEPIVKLLEVCAYRELILRQRINEAARSQLLAFAAGADLDHLAAFYDVARLAGESDGDLRRRVQARIVGWSTAGAGAHYRAHALGASTSIQDVAVTSVTPGEVLVCVLVREGADAAAVVDAVRQAVTRDDVRVLTDTVRVVDAQMVPVAVEAAITLLPGVPDSRIDELRASLMARFRADVRLGWDVTRSYLIHHLHGSGVHHVDLLSPADEVRCAPHQAAALTRVDLSLAGRES